MPFKDVLAEFARSKVAIHTMWKEHFGIAVVELLASGLLTIAHNSAGPKEDIIGGTKNTVGFLADTVEEYAQLMAKCINEFDKPSMRSVREAARKSVDRFSCRAFDQTFIYCIRDLFPASCQIKDEKKLN